MSTVPPGPRPSLLVLAYLAFASLGLPDGLLGVGWPSIRAEFGVPTEAVGLLLTAGTTGYLTSSVVAGFSVARLGVGRLLAASTAIASLALAGYAASPRLALIVGCALLLGIGSGAVDSGLNAYAAGAFGPRHMNWMHAFFGLGVAIGPLVMTAVLGASLAWRWGYGIVATAQLLLALAFVLTVRSWGDGRGAGEERRPSPGRPGDADESARSGSARSGPASASGGRRAPVPVWETLRLRAVWFGAVAFAVYVAIEVATGLWAFPLLTDGRGLDATRAGVCVSGYWGCLFLGRVVQGVVAERLGTRLVLRGSLATMALGALLVAIPGSAWLAVAGFAVLGFAAAPVFPLLTLATAERVGAAHADRTIGLQIASSGLGGALVPSGIGYLLGRYGSGVLGPILLALSLLLIVLLLAADRYSAANGRSVPGGDFAADARSVGPGR